MSNSTYARAAIQGEISIGPERQTYGEKGDKELVKFTLVVTQQSFGENPPVRMPFQVTCFGKQAELALTLQRYQRVLVLCDLRNKQKESNGYVFDNISVTANMILPFATPQPQQQQMPQQAAQAPHPAPQPQPQQQSHQPRILQQQGLAPQQLPNEADADIPF